MRSRCAVASLLLLILCAARLRADDALPVAPAIAPDVVRFPTSPATTPQTFSPYLSYQTTSPSLSFVFFSEAPPPIGSTPDFLTPFPILGLSLCAWMLAHLYIARRRNNAIR